MSYFRNGIIGLEKDLKLTLNGTREFRITYDAKCNNYKSSLTRSRFLRRVGCLWEYLCSIRLFSA